jgi:peptide/nickel transport system substrate-binding protein
LVLIIGACGGKKDDGGQSDEVGDPVRGGSVTYAVEAETNDGWCLQESQLAISGILVARALYDTLTVPNDKGE